MVVGVGRERVCARDGWAVVCVHVCVASVVVSIVRWRGVRVAALACVWLVGSVERPQVPTGPHRSSNGIGAHST